MSKSRMYVDGHAYSQFDPEEVHRDLDADPAQTRRVMAASRGVAEAHKDCNECQRITAAHSGATDTGYASLDEAITAHSERATNFVIPRANLARMMGLGAGERIARMFVTDDPHYLHVVIAGEHFKPVPDGQPVPISMASPGVKTARTGGDQPDLAELNRTSRAAARARAVASRGH